MPKTSRRLSRLHPGAGYQAFGALKRYTPRERVRLIAMVQKKHWPSLIATSFAVAAGVATWTLFVIEAWTKQIRPAVNFNAWVLNEPSRAVGMCLGLLALLMIGPVVGLFVRDRWLKWALARHTSQSHCHECQYPYLDIPVERERMTCPECGECAVVVNARGVIPARVLEV